MRFVNIKWKFAGEWEPQIVIADDNGLKAVKMWGSFLKMSVGERFCAGRTNLDTYYKCDNKPENGERLCAGCAKGDEWLPCVKCRGSCLNLKKRPACETLRYIVYLAAFGSRVKVGVSNYFRFFPRILEQGADFAVNLLEVTDGGYARQVEQEISSKLNITDRVKSEFKMRNLMTDPDNSINSLLLNIANIRGAFEVGQVKIYDMRRFYRINALDEPVRNLPSKEISGNVTGVKGSIAVLQNSAGFSAVNFRDVIGCDIEIETVDLIKAERLSLPPVHPALR